MALSEAERAFVVCCDALGRQGQQAAMAFGAQLRRPDGSLCDTAQSIRGKRFVLLYFSAHWCPPCRRFTPVLAEFYERHAEVSADDLEVIFVSGDRDPAQYSTYHGSMPWLALPYENTMQRQMMNMQFGVRGIPALVLLDASGSGRVLDRNARQAVMNSRGNTEYVVDMWKRL